MEHIFPNGLKLLMIKRDTAPTIAPYILFKAGSVDESDDTRGIAHMLEHMLFKGTKTIGTKDYEKEKVVLAEIDRIGDALDMERAKGSRADAEKIAELQEALKTQQELAKEWIVTGEYTEIYTQHGSTGFNAGTSVDYTIYIVELPSNKLELWAMLESDRLKNAVLREFYVEREAVKEERRMRVDTVQAVNSTNSLWLLPLPRILMECRLLAGPQISRCSIDARRKSFFVSTTHRITPLWSLLEILT